MLYSFSGTDGATPQAALIFDAAGNLYSTTVEGGAYNQGTLFKLTPAGGGTWTETVLHSFGNGTDGARPQAGLIFDAAGNLYGTTTNGGSYGGGTVFRFNAQGEVLLQNFSGADGANPLAGLVLDAGGNLYGTTYVWRHCQSGNGVRDHKYASGSLSIRYRSSLPAGGYAAAERRRARFRAAPSEPSPFRKRVAATFRRPRQRTRSMSRLCP